MYYHLEMDMDCIVNYKEKSPPEKEILVCVCRFCMLRCEGNEVVRIFWDEWQYSLLAAMYERIMNQEVRILFYLKRTIN